MIDAPRPHPIEVEGAELAPRKEDLPNILKEIVSRAQGLQAIQYDLNLTAESRGSQERDLRHELIDLCSSVDDTSLAQFFPIIEQGGTTRFAVEIAGQTHHLGKFEGLANIILKIADLNSIAQSTVAQ